MYIFNPAEFTLSYIYIYKEYDVVVVVIIIIILRMMIITLELLCHKMIWIHLL